MKCPICNAPTIVLETRLRLESKVHRRRECFNEHIFTTIEQVNKIGKKHDNKKQIDKSDSQRDA